ncbi:MAG: protein phosphatase [Pseudomonadota bacterium]
MSVELVIATVTLDNGARIGIAPMPGRRNPVEVDAARIADWGATLVLSMTMGEEMPGRASDPLQDALAVRDVAMIHLPIPDWGVPPTGVQLAWPDAAARAHEVLDAGGAILTHCAGGHGRSGMATMRLMTERGMTPDDALRQIRLVRPGAVETADQQSWAAQGYP